MIKKKNLILTITNNMNPLTEIAVNNNMLYFSKITYLGNRRIYNILYIVPDQFLLIEKSVFDTRTRTHIVHQFNLSMF